jgi:CheY-like chemotaxis protein
MDEAERKRRELVAMLAHSLRNPFAAIQGALVRLQAAGWNAPELDTIEQSLDDARHVLDESLEVQPTPRRPRKRSTTTRRVLVVDDNVEAARGLEVLLSKQGFEVATAFDGASGVDAALANVPDAVLLDLALGAVSGYDVARRIRAEPRLAGTRLIALTGFDQQTDRERTRAHGFADHLVKPVVLEDLLAALEG